MPTTHVAAAPSVHSGEILQKKLRAWKGTLLPLGFLWVFLGFSYIYLFQENHKQNTAGVFVSDEVNMGACLVMAHAMVIRS